MRLNRFKIRIIIQSVLIAFSGFFAVYSFQSAQLWITRVSFIILWVFLVANLIRYISLTNRSISSFLDSLKYLDNVYLEDKGDRSLRDLNLSFNEIINVVKETERKTEAQSVYLKSILEHIGTGLISYDGKAKIKLINKAAIQLLRTPGLSCIDNLKALDKRLPEKILRMNPGDSLLLTLLIEGELTRLIFRKAEMKIMGEDLNILSIQDIRSQLEEEELETWKNLISILRHEIMNSVAPLNSLGLSLQKITEKAKTRLETDEYTMLKEGLEAISRRSDGLMNFVQVYRTLTSLPKPACRAFPVSRLINKTIPLFTSEFEKRKIVFKTEVSDSLSVRADFDLISQIIINLLKNSMEAITHEKGEIRITASELEGNYVKISVQDNGAGINEEDRAKVFLPFYTTKEEGSGIGLSLARQIMRMHKGNIEVKSEAGKGSVFSIKLWAESYNTQAETEDLC